MRYLFPPEYTKIEIYRVKTDRLIQITNIYRSDDSIETTRRIQYTSLMIISRAFVLFADISVIGSDDQVSPFHA